MFTKRFIFLSAIVFIAAFYSMSVFAAGFPRLEKPPVGEQWFIINFSDEHAGFSYTRISENDSGYEMYSESSVKMGGFAFSREASIRETYMVNPDLTLRSFMVNQTIDGKAMVLHGEVSQSGIKAVIESGGVKKVKTLKTKKAVYPPMALNILPLMKGVRPGGNLRVSMLDSEEVKLKNVEISVVGIETFHSERAMHLRNDLYPVDNDIRIDAKGNTIEESVRDGWIVTGAQPENAVRRFISESALSGRDFMVNFGLVRVEPPISQPEKLKKLEAEISGWPAGVEPLPGPSQAAALTDGDMAIFTVINTPVPVNMGKSDGETVPEELVESTDPLLKSTANDIIGDEKNPAVKAKKLVQWVSSNIREEVSVSRSPRETFKEKSGNRLDKARLYVALAKAAGLPTKMVSGLVYSSDRGFFYQSWAETFVGYRLPVDPVLGEAPTDAAHIKLVEDDTPEAMAALSRFIGHVGMKVIKKEY